MLLIAGPSPQSASGAATAARTLLAMHQDRWPDAAVDFHAVSGPDLSVLGGVGRAVAGALEFARFSRSLAQSRPARVHLCAGLDRSGYGLRLASTHAELAQRAGSRVVLHLHGAGLADRRSRRLSELPIGRAVTRVDALAVATEQQARALASWGAPVESIVVLPNGVQAAPYSPPEARVAHRGAPLRLLAFGPLTIPKGIDTLLRAVERVRRARGPVLAVRLAGAPGASPALVRRWMRQGRGSGVEFIGVQPHASMARELAACEGVLLPTLADELPFALLESLGATRPVLASSTGRISHVLREGAGDTVPPSDPAALAAGILRWLDDPERRVDVAAAGWHRVRREHGLESTARGFEAAWDRAERGSA